MSRLSGLSKNQRLFGTLRELLYYKSGLIGLAMLTILVIISLYTVIAIPADKAIYLWRSSEPWLDNPRTAAPEWIQIFIGRNLPKTIILNSDSDSLKTVSSYNGLKELKIELSFNYNYDDFPSEMNLFLKAKVSNASKLPQIRLEWIKPDGERIKLLETSLQRLNVSYYISVNEIILQNLVNYIKEKYGFIPSERCTQLKLLFGEYSIQGLKTGDLPVLKGQYKLIVTVTLFSEADDVSAKLVVYGIVYGIAGTDHLRRPLEIALLWGTPVALAFGLTASVVTTLIQLIIATIAAYYGGILDSLVQRVTEIYMVLPFLSFLIMIAVFYRIDIWTILIVIIILSIFSGGIKSTRALVMQIKEYPYVEAARAYGASNTRIIFFYIIPKIIPPVVPSLISAVPGYVFLEAALAFLGLGDPFLPTWGKVINDAFENGAVYRGYYYWVLEPSLLLIITGLAFAFLGFALDRIVNPKLREL